MEQYVPLLRQKIPPIELAPEKTTIFMNKATNIIIFLPFISISCSIYTPL